jgi:ABC-type dipeptide/oligopeptide/nickel transport system permease component
MPSHIQCVEPSPDILFLSVVFVIVNLVTDVVYAKADPRVAHD